MVAVTILSIAKTHDKRLPVISKVSMEGNDEIIVVSAMPVSVDDNENNGDEDILNAVGDRSYLDGKRKRPKFSLGKTRFNLLQLVYPSP